MGCSKKKKKEKEKRETDNFPDIKGLLGIPY